MGNLCSLETTRPSDEDQSAIRFTISILMADIDQITPPQLSNIAQYFLFVNHLLTIRT
jgi:hypothetical protein